jgi:putative endonuclease
MMSDWFLYIIRCYDGSLYAGISTDVDRRFSEHQSQGAAGSKYLKGRSPLTLVFRQNLGHRSLALKVELKVKKLSRGRKERLIKVPGYIEEIIRRANQ